MLGVVDFVSITACCCGVPACRRFRILLWFSVSKTTGRVKTVYPAAPCIGCSTSNKSIAATMVAFVRRHAPWWSKKVAWSIRLKSCSHTVGVIFVKICGFCGFIADTGEQPRHRYTSLDNITDVGEG